MQVYHYVQSSHKFIEVYILETCIQMHVGLHTLKLLTNAYRYIYIYILEICVEMKAT